MKAGRPANKKMTYDLLIEIMKNPKSDQVQLAKKLGVSKGRINQIVKELTNKGVLAYVVERYFILKRLDKV